MAKKTSDARRTVARLGDELPALLDSLLDRAPMLKAYLVDTPLTCGSPSCRCARGEKHPAWVAKIPEGGATRSRSIPEHVFRRLKPLAEEYRQFRQKLARVRRLFKQAEAALRDIETSRLVDLEEELRRES